MDFVPEKMYYCQAEYIEFIKILKKVITRRGKRKEKHVKELQTFFCDTIHKVMYRQRECVDELHGEKVALETKLKSLENEVNYLRRNQSNSHQEGNPLPYRMSLRDIQTRITNLEDVF